MIFPLIFALINTIIFADLSRYDTNAAISAFYTSPNLSSSAFKARYCGELVDKRHKRTADLEKPLSCADIRDIAELKVGDIKELG